MSDGPATSEPRSWVERSRKQLHENPWFGVLEQEVELPDGSTRIYYSLDFPNPAVAAVVRRGGSYLLVRQYRFIVDEHVWAIPSGGVEPGETLEAAARREVLEETGHRALSLRHLMGFYASYGCGNQRFEIFLAEDPEYLGIDPDPNEILSMRWFSEGEIMAMLLRDEIPDALSLAPLMKLCLDRTVGVGE